MDIKLQPTLFDQQMKDAKEKESVTLGMELKLNAPGLTSLHKAGLAGLYMTLRAFEKKNETIDGLEWQLESQKVILRWTREKLKTAFGKLIEKSFWIDEKGFIRLSGLELEKELSFEQRHHLYNALLNSFLQFGPHRPTGNKQTLTYEVDEKLCWIKDFAPVKNIRQRGAVKDFVDDDGNFKDSIEAAGWLFPGAAQRHTTHKNTKLNESPETALLLLFAPIGVVYYMIRSRAKGRKARLALLIPEIQDLELYAEVRRVIAAQGVMELTACSASDAALRMLITIKANRTSEQFARVFGGKFVCRVITFGIVSWSEQQKTRTFVHSVFSGRLSSLENYRLAAQIFQNRWQRVHARIGRSGNPTEPERHFVTTFSTRELIADNLAQGKAWYQDIAIYMTKKETREWLFYERKELNEMVEKASFNDESERLFIDVCQESWRRHMGKLSERANREGADRGRLIQKEFERLRVSISHSRNAHTLRETVVDFWARAGRNEGLQGNSLQQLLPLFDEKNWRKARDLVLLALISYKPRSKEEEDLLANIENEEEESNE